MSSAATVAPRGTLPNCYVCDLVLFPLARGTTWDQVSLTYGAGREPQKARPAAVADRRVLLGPWSTRAKESFRPDAVLTPEDPSYGGPPTWRGALPPTAEGGRLLGAPSRWTYPSPVRVRPRTPATKTTWATSTCVTTTASITGGVTRPTMELTGRARVDVHSRPVGIAHDLQSPTSRRRAAPLRRGTVQRTSRGMNEGRPMTRPPRRSAGCSPVAKTNLVRVLLLRGAFSARRPLHPPGIRT